MKPFSSTYKLSAASESVSLRYTLPYPQLWRWTRWKWSMEKASLGTPELHPSIFLLVLHSLVISNCLEKFSFLRCRIIHTCTLYCMFMCIYNKCKSIPIYQQENNLIENRVVFGSFLLFLVVFGCFWLFLVNRHCFR